VTKFLVFLSTLAFFSNNPPKLSLDGNSSPNGLGHLLTLGVNSSLHVIGVGFQLYGQLKKSPHDVERSKRDFDCDKQVEKAVTAPNRVLKGSWEEGGSGGIRKKLKSEYAAYLESKFRRNDGSSI